MNFINGKKVRNRFLLIYFAFLLGFANFANAHNEAVSITTNITPGTLFDTDTYNNFSFPASVIVVRAGRKV